MNNKFSTNYFFINLKFLETIMISLCNQFLQLSFLSIQTHLSETSSNILSNRKLRYEINTLRWGSISCTEGAKKINQCRYITKTYDKWPGLMKYHVISFVKTIKHNMPQLFLENKLSTNFLLRKCIDMLSNESVL